MNYKKKLIKIVELSIGPDMLRLNGVIKIDAYVSSVGL